MDPDQTNSLSGNITRGLVQVHEALSREHELEDEGGRVARVVRRHRGVIVLTTIVGAFWLCIAGGVSAASSHQTPFASLTLAADHEAPFTAAAAVPGPIEWPTIAIAPKKKIEKPKKKH